MSSDRRLRRAVEERRLRSRRLAEVALERYGLRDARIELMRDAFVQVSRVASPSRGEFVLRTYDLPPASEDASRSEPAFRTSVTLRSPETLRSQLEWLLSLRRETDLLVPEPVPTLDGSFLAHVSVRGAPRGRHFVLLRWVSGKNKGKDLAPTDFSRVGSFMARLHNHAEQYRAPDPAALPRWDWDWPFGEAASLWNEGPAFYSADEMSVFEEAARRVRCDLGELGYGKGVFGLVHRDLNLRNLVFHEETVGAVDFDLCGLGHYLLDIVSAIAGLRPLHTDRLEQMKEALLEGYEHERSLHPGYEMYGRTFTVMRRVAAVNRNLELLASAATRHEARGHRFLRNSVTWLERSYLRDPESRA